MRESVLRFLIENFPPRETSINALFQKEKLRALNLIKAPSNPPTNTPVKKIALNSTTLRLQSAAPRRISSLQTNTDYENNTFLMNLLRRCKQDRKTLNTSYIKIGHKMPLPKTVPSPACFSAYNHNQHPLNDPALTLQIARQANCTSSNLPHTSTTM